MRSSPTSSAADRLRTFRAAHAIRTHVIGEHVWDVIAGGRSGPLLVLLPAGGGSAESQFHLIDRLENAACVLSIGCPATITNFAEVVEGLARLLDEYGAQECFMLGHSLGGIFAQAFAAAYSQRVRGLILANTAAYSPRRGRFLSVALRSARYVPKRLLMSYLHARARRLLGNHPDREFWVEYFSNDEFERLGVRGAANRGRCIADSIARRTADTTQYAGPALIIDSDNESAFTVAERLALKRAYPNASVHMFHGAGHLSSITRFDDFVAAVLEFMERLQSPVPH